MWTRLDPREIYLLERFISLDYFGEMRDVWERMVRHVDSRLQLFMQNLRSNYRSAPLPEQPDIVWGNRVLPNFLDTLHELNKGFILLTHGDLRGLGAAHGPVSDFKGQMDYWSGWMSKEDDETYHQLLLQAESMAGNITRTEGAYWNPTEMEVMTDHDGPLNLPAQWPLYRINKNVWVKSGEKNQRAGIYIPDVENGCAQFLNTRLAHCSQAHVLARTEDLVHPTTKEKYGEQPVFEKRDCTWYLVERSPVSDILGTVASDDIKRRLMAAKSVPKLASTSRLRVLARAECSVRER